MVDVVVIAVAVVVAVMFAISATAAIIILRKARRGEDTGPKDNWRSSGLLGRSGRSGTDTSSWGGTSDSDGPGGV